MEKIEKYEVIVLNVLNNQIVELTNSNVQDYIIADKEKRHYQLLRMGWDTPDDPSNSDFLITDRDCLENQSIYKYSEGNLPKHSLNWREKFTISLKPTE